MKQNERENEKNNQDSGLLSEGSRLVSEMEKEGKKERERVRMKERNPLRDWYQKERKSVRKKENKKEGKKEREEVRMKKNERDKSPERVDCEAKGPDWYHQQNERA